MALQGSPAPPDRFAASVAVGSRILFGLPGESGCQVTSGEVSIVLVLLLWLLLLLRHSA